MREEPVELDASAQIAEPQPPPLPESISEPLGHADQPVKIGFRNALAVKIALMAAAGSLLVSMVIEQVPGLQLFGLFLVPIASGFFAVQLYRRQSGQKLTPISGAHLGWLSGIFGFTITTVLLTFVAVMLTQPEIASAFLEQAKQSRPEMIEAINQFRTPEGIGRSLAISFVLFTLLPTFGGTLGAKLSNRD